MSPMVRLGGRRLGIAPWHFHFVHEHLVILNAICLVCIGLEFLRVQVRRLGWLVAEAIALGGCVGGQAIWMVVVYF